MSADVNASTARPIRTGGPYAWYVLFVLVLVSIMNLIDRQLISILAEDIKADLGIGDAQMGFLYGTVFGVFYALFGVALGRLADMCHRLTLLAAGIGLWSCMTALSGLAKDFGTLAAARIGVGVGEASAAPVAYSVLSDLFPNEYRATVIAIYSSGVYLGVGLSMFLGGSIKDSWNAAFPGGGPFGLVGWQAAFLLVGIPGLLLALLVSTLREPVRGAIDGIVTIQEPHPFRSFATELASVIPPFTFFHAAGHGPRALAANLAAAAVAVAAAVGLIAAFGDWPQWSALCAGGYTTFSWAQSLKRRDLPTYALIWGTPTFLFNIVGFGSMALVTYATNFWSAPYAIRSFGIDAATAGLFLGGGGAIGGFLGVIAGGRLADRFRRSDPAGRTKVGFIAIAGSGPLLLMLFTTESLPLFYALALLSNVFASMWVGIAISNTQDLVLPRMRGTAGATQVLGATLIGLGLGPYAVGKISEGTGDLGFANVVILSVYALSAACLLYVYRNLPAAEASRVERAGAVGEPFKS